MSFENSKFGYAGGATTASSPAVNNHYGPRDVGKTVGVSNTEGFKNELTIDLDGEMVGAAAFPLIPPKIPAGSIINSVVVQVEEVFVLGGTSPVIEIGTEGSEATNGVSITEAQAEATGTYDVTAALAGTWAAGLAAETTLGIALSGTTPTVTDAGKARVVITYTKM
jgi:hypothetical protein